MRQIYIFISRLNIFNILILQDDTQWQKIFTVDSDIYLLDHYICPSSFKEVFDIFYPRTSLCMDALTKFTSSLIADITQITWSSYRQAFKAYELSVGITKKKKL